MQLENNKVNVSVPLSTNNQCSVMISLTVRHGRGDIAINVSIDFSADMQTFLIHCEGSWIVTLLMLDKANTGKCARNLQWIGLVAALQVQNFVIVFQSLVVLEPLLMNLSDIGESHTNIEVPWLQYCHFDF